MTDTITESFCERCGTRYAFEQVSKSRRARFGRLRVLTKGLTTFVSNDGMPLADAMAAARDDEERAELARQLDAFHQTFSFCLSCRQYTCGSCWNAIAGQCLSCAPDPTREVLPAPSAGLAIPEAATADGAELRLEASAWPEADLAPPVPAAVFEPAAPEVAVEAAPAPELAPAPEPEVAVEAAPESEPAAAPEPEVTVAPELAPAPEPADLTADELSQIELALAQARQAIEPAEPGEPPRQPAEAAEPSAVTAPDSVPARPAQPSEPVDHAAAARDRTRRLLGRFRPARAAPAPGVPRPEPAAEEPPSEPEVAAAAALPTPQAAPAAEPEAAAPAGGVAAASSPVSAPDSRVDAVEQPTWQIVAPDGPLPPGSPAVLGRPPAGPPAWPEPPAWPAGPTASSQRPAADAAAWATRIALSRSAPTGVWAASSRELLGGPALPGTAAAVQACVSCGLPLSATARFCRRCGSRQS
jgi:hypothetical protein